MTTVFSQRFMREVCFPLYINIFLIPCEKVRGACCMRMTLNAEFVDKYDLEGGGSKDHASLYLGPVAK